jgi:type II secretory pathway pseudopilin PulG
MRTTALNAPLRRARKAHGGFTLIEIMVSVGLLLALIGATFGVLIATNNTSQRIYRIASTQETARLALDMLAADIRGAGLGIASGEVGIAPGGSSASTTRIPVIFSGPDVVVQEPGLRSTLITNSIFIVSAEPTTLGLPADGSGIQGVVLDAGLTGVNAPLEVACSRSDGGTAACETTADAILLTATSPLLIGDLRNASIITPTAIHASGNAGAELINYKEAGAISIDPKANYAIYAHAMLSRLRVVHWYLKQTDPTAPPRLYRSKPILTTNLFNCSSGGWPFVDETTVANSPVVGVDMGAGPVQSLQIRYVLDPTNGTSPTPFQTYQMSSAINPCDAADIVSNVVPQAVSKLREVRVQVVSIATQPDLTTAGSQKLLIGYTTPQFEGSLWTPDGGSLTDAGTSTALTDPYPRRAFTVRVVPRAVQLVRL